METVKCYLSPLLNYFMLHLSRFSSRQVIRYSQNWRVVGERRAKHPLIGMVSKISPRLPVTMTVSAKLIYFTYVGAKGANPTGWRRATTFTLVTTSVERLALNKYTRLEPGRAGW